jgi:hypothetical protein
LVSAKVTAIRYANARAPRERATSRKRNGKLAQKRVTTENGTHPPAFAQRPDTAQALPLARSHRSTDGPAYPDARNPMNYRHAFHAGNFADVFKHSILLGLLESLKSKHTAFCYFDTHAGRGRYDLRSEHAAAGALAHLCQSRARTQ